MVQLTTERKRIDCITDKLLVSFSRIFRDKKITATLYLLMKSYVSSDDCVQETKMSSFASVQKIIFLDMFHNQIKKNDRSYRFILSASYKKVNMTMRERHALHFVSLNTV